MNTVIEHFCATDYVWILYFVSEILAECMFAAHWTGALQVQPRFRNM